MCQCMRHQFMQPQGAHVPGQRRQRSCPWEGRETCCAQPCSSGRWAWAGSRAWGMPPLRGTRNQRGRSLQTGACRLRCWPHGGCVWGKPPPCCACSRCAPELLLSRLLLWVSAHAWLGTWTGACNEAEQETAGQGRTARRVSTVSAAAVSEGRWANPSRRCCWGKNPARAGRTSTAWGQPVRAGPSPLRCAMHGRRTVAPGAAAGLLRASCAPKRPPQ